jgi:DNA-binding CsgD family transcriptional regulator
MTGERPWVESLVACIPDGLMLVAGDGTIVWASPEFCALAAAPGGAKGRQAGEFLRDWDQLRPALESALRDRPRAEHDAVLRGADGAVRAVVVSAAACRPGIGAALALHVRDDEEAGRLRRQLAEREQSHSFLKAGVSDLVVRCDAAWRVTWANEAAGPLFTEGGDLRGMLAPESLACLEAVADGDGATRAPISIESARGRRPAFYLKGIARRLEDEAGAFAGVSMIVRDDSEHRRLAMLCARLQLTPREQEVAEYLLNGFSNLNIAAILGLSESGVKFHVRNIFARARVSTRTELMALLLQD